MPDAIWRRETWQGIAITTAPLDSSARRMAGRYREQVAIGTAAYHAKRAARLGALPDQRERPVELTDTDVLPVVDA